MHRLRKESMREEEMDYSNLFVVLMGLGTVFAGLLCIILLVTLMSWVCARTSAPKTVPQMPAAPATMPASGAVTPAMMAAVAAAIAEDMGTDVSAIRIVSMKKV